MPKIAPAPKCPSCGQSVRYTPHSACPFCKVPLRPILHPSTGRVIQWVLARRFRG